MGLELLQPGLVSVIMSNYNTPEEYLRTAIDSILNQTYTNFEFIIVDDCSTDASKDVIKSYRDSRIILIENEKNLGLTKSLNVALRAAKGEFIARMDSDDYSYPDRLDKQVDFMRRNPEYILCGTAIELFGNGANKYKQKTIIKEVPAQEEWKIRQLFDNSTNIIHPTAMFRHQLLLDNHIQYNESYIYAQDYRIWIDCNKAAKCTSLSDVLFKYRIHDGAISSSKKAIQDDCARRIMEEQLSWLGLRLPKDWEKIHRGFFDGRKEYDLNQRNWIRTIIVANKIHKVYQQSLLKQMLWEKWAETTYFKLNKSSILEKVRVLFWLPIRYWNELISIKKSRLYKENGNGRF